MSDLDPYIEKMREAGIEPAEHTSADALRALHAKAIEVVEASRRCTFRLNVTFGPGGERS